MGDASWCNPLCIRTEKIKITTSLPLPPQALVSLPLSCGFPFFFATPTHIRRITLISIPSLFPARGLKGCKILSIK